MFTEEFFQMFLAVFLIICLNVYVLTGGADVGYGIMHLFSPKTNKEKYHRVLNNVFAPLWELNHVWLVAVVVVLFVNFVNAFSHVATSLNIAITLFTIALIMRGSAFVFSFYNPNPDGMVAQVWNKVMAVSSIAFIFFLGMAGAGIIGGLIPSKADINDFSLFEMLNSWISIFSVLIGITLIFACTHLGSLYSIFETKDVALKNHFAKYALFSSILLHVFLVLALVVSEMGIGATYVENLAAMPLFWIWLILLVAMGVVSMFGLVSNNYKLSLILSILQVSWLIWGSAIAQFPYMVPGPAAMSIFDGAGIETVKYTSMTFAIGACFLLPVFGYLYYIFKTDKARLQS